MDAPGGEDPFTHPKVLSEHLQNCSEIPASPSKVRSKVKAKKSKSISQANKENVNTNGHVLDTGPDNNENASPPKTHTYLGFNYRWTESGFKCCHCEGHNVQNYAGKRWQNETLMRLHISNCHTAPPAPKKPERKKNNSKAKATEASARTARPDQMTLPAMVTEAVIKLNDKNGSTLNAIRRFIERNHTDINIDKVEPSINQLLISYIREGVLVHPKGKGLTGSFKLASCHQY